MKTVRIKNGIVAEIIPEYALPVADWYGAAFAASCVEAPDEVGQRWTYDPETGTFAAPAPKEDPEEPAGDIETRVAALESGKADKSDLEALTAAIQKGLSL